MSIILILIWIDWIVHELWVKNGNKPFCSDSSDYELLIEEQHCLNLWDYFQSKWISSPDFQFTWTYLLTLGTGTIIVKANKKRNCRMNMWVLLRILANNFGFVWFHLSSFVPFASPVLPRRSMRLPYLRARQWTNTLFESTVIRFFGHSQSLSWYI